MDRTARRSHAGTRRDLPEGRGAPALLLGSVEPFAAEGGAPSRLRTLPSCCQEYRTMLDPVNEVGVHVGARLLDFFDARSPWNRRLWNVGLSLTLREVLEAAEAASSGELSPRSLNFLAELAQRMVGTDPAAGMDEEKRLLQGALRAKLLRPGGLDYQVVAQQEERVRTAYLSAWANALREPQPPGAERTARAITSHLLDMGYSSDFLHRWWKYRIWHESGNCSLADIVEEAHQLTRQPTRSFDVMVPVLRAIRATGTPPAEWRPPQRVSAWLRDNGFGVSGVRQDGGFLFRIEARDPDAAVGRVSEVLDRDDIASAAILVDPSQTSCQTATGPRQVVCRPRLSRRRLLPRLRAGGRRARRRDGMPAPIVEKAVAAAPASEAGAGRGDATECREPPVAMHPMHLRFRATIVHRPGGAHGAIGRVHP